MVEEDWQSELKAYAVDPAVKLEARKKFNYRPFVEAPETKCKENTLEIEALDFSTYKEGPKGLQSRQKLADQLEQALTTYGFFKVVNFGLSNEILQEVLSISQSTFDEPEDVKTKFLAGEKKLPEEEERPLGIVRGSGYKPKGYWKYTEDTSDNVEFFNFRQFLQFDTFFNRIEYPEFVRDNLDFIAFYFNYIHREVARRVSTLIDLILELPEGTVYNKFFAAPQTKNITESPDGFARFLLYHPTSDDYNEHAHNIWLRGHSDGSALTFILSQSIMSLQIREYETQQWKYATHTPGALIVNIGDMFQQITGGYFRSSVHRVVTAPEDQRKYYRNTAIYFCNTTPSAYLDPEYVGSPKLERLGIRRDASLPRVTGGQWDDAKGGFLNNKSANRTNGISFYGRQNVGSLVVDDKGAIAT